MTTTTSYEELETKAQLNSIREMVETWRSADVDNDQEALDLATEAIQEDPLSVAVRSDWTPAGQRLVAEEYCILLCTGGPAVRMVGDLDSNREPFTAQLQHQDWGTPWTAFLLTKDEEQDCLTYAQVFDYSS